jgi:hypothetical protein
MMTEDTNESYTVVPIGRPKLIEITRKLSLTPPFFEITERIFSTTELAIEFEELRNEIKRLNEMLEIQAKLVEVGKKDVKALEKEAEKIPQLEKKIQQVEKLNGETRRENTRLSQTIEQERRRSQQALTEATSLKTQVDQIERRYKQKDAELNTTVNEFETYKTLATTQISTLESKLNETETQLNRHRVVLDLVPKVRDIPFGLERVLEKGGYEVVESVHLPSYPPLFGPKKPFVRPTQDSEKYNLVGLCMAKDRKNVKSSQDALAFEVRHGGLYVGIADGVSSSHRQSEWAHRLARAAKSATPVDAINEAKTSHKAHAETMLELVDPAFRWMEEQSLHKSSEATLLCLQDIGDGKVLVKRRGDVWAASFSAGTWQVVMEPSAVAATTAFSSDSPIHFDVELDIARPERMLVMTDGVHPTDQEGLEALWLGLHAEDENSFASWVNACDQEGVFDSTDDVSVLAITFKG